jgi:hypothetical protein
LRLSHERLQRLETENRLLRELRRLDLLEKYGPAGEKLSDEQLLEREPGVSSAEVEAESERAQLKLPLKTLKKHPGRQELPAHLPRIEKIIACTPEQCVCGKCGKENSVIGYEKSEQLDVKPAEYFVVVSMREKRACKALSARRRRFGSLRKAWPVIGSSSIQWSASMPITCHCIGKVRFCRGRLALMCPERLWMVGSCG